MYYVNNREIEMIYLTFDMVVKHSVTEARADGIDETLPEIIVCHAHIIKN